MSGFENAVEGNAVISIQLAPPEDMRVLLVSLQAHVKDCIGLNPVVAAEFVTDSELNGLAGIPEEIEKGFKVRPRDPGDEKSFSRAELRVERSRHRFACGNLYRRHEMKPCLLIIVLSSHAHQLVALGIVEAGNPGREWSKLVSQVKVISSGIIRKVNSEG